MTTRPKLEDIFNREVEDIRNNLPMGDGGNYQEYLRSHFTHSPGTHSVHFVHPSNDMTVQVALFSKDGKAYVQIHMPKVECVRPVPDQYKAHELDVLTRELPEDLQLLLIKE